MQLSRFEDVLLSSSLVFENLSIISTQLSLEVNNMSDGKYGTLSCVVMHIPSCSGFERPDSQNS